MNYDIKFAKGFMNLFQSGANTFIGKMTSIVPLVLRLRVAMNVSVNILGGERVEKLAKVSAKNPVTRYIVLPFISAFMLENPMSMIMGRFLPEFYKAIFIASQM